MTRNHRELRVFQQADSLVILVYKAITSFPSEERYGLQSQIRRAAVSVPTNIVEGCARRTEKEYLNFLNIAMGSASELRYLLDLSSRLGFLNDTAFLELDAASETLLRALQKLLDSLGSAARSLKPEAQEPL